MRGDDNQQEGIFSYISPEKRVPADHPLRPIRAMLDEILKERQSCTPTWAVRRLRQSGCAVAAVTDLLFGTQ